MADQYRLSMIDTMTLLSTSTINTLHFPALAASGISDSGGSRRTSILLDGIGMCESMTESFHSTGNQDDSTNPLYSETSLNGHAKVERRDSTKKRRSRKAQYDASIDDPSLEKIETVNLIDEDSEPDDAWLYEAPKGEHQTNSSKDNIFSWVHQEFKSNDINASKHRLLCKLDDMSNARTIRSVSCHNFLDNPRSDSVKRSSTEQQVHSEPIKNGRLSSPLRATTPLFHENDYTQPTSPAHPSAFRITNTTANTNGTYTDGRMTAAIQRSREASREREKGPLDYTDLEVMAKVQLENLRQAERQGPLSKRFGGSNISLASTSSGTSISNRPGTKPPVAPRSTVVRNSVKPKTYQRSNTQTIISSSSEAPAITESKPLVTLATRVSLLPPNSANNTNRTRPPTARPIQSYRGSQTTYNNSKAQLASSSVERNGKKLPTDLRSTFPSKEFSSNENGLLHDVSNKPLNGPIRSQVGPQRRTILPQTAVEQNSASTSSVNGQPTLPRSSSSSLSQGRKSGIPTVGKLQKPTSATVTRSSSSTLVRTSNGMMVNRNAQTPQPYTRPQQSSWSDGCY